MQITMQIVINNKDEWDGMRECVDRLLQCGSSGNNESDNRNFIVHYVNEEGDNFKQKKIYRFKFSDKIYDVNPSTWYEFYKQFRVILEDLKYNISDARPPYDKISSRSVVSNVRKLLRNNNMPDTALELHMNK